MRKIANSSNKGEVGPFLLTALKYFSPKKCAFVLISSLLGFLRAMCVHKCLNGLVKRNISVWTAADTWVGEGSC